MSVEKQKASQKADPFWWVTTFLDHIPRRFMRFFVCHQNIDIDEMCIGFKGRHVARCYNPKKKTGGNPFFNGWRSPLTFQAW